MKIGERSIGPGEPVYIIGEIGINHNGSVEHARKLVMLAKQCGFDAVKFQKRTPELCVPVEQRQKLRETPWGTMTYMEYRQKMEFGQKEYEYIDEACRRVGMTWFASCWDCPSVDFIEKFNVPCWKIASACLTDVSLLQYVAMKSGPVLLSTGMSELAQIDKAVVALRPADDLALLHSVSVYPANVEDLNLRCIKTLADRYRLPVGYSGHESGLPTTLAAVALGACIVERHITTDRALWGSDHAASLGPSGMNRLVNEIRLVEKSLGDGVKRVVESERPMMAKLRR